MEKETIVRENFFEHSILGDQECPTINSIIILFGLQKSGSPPKLAVATFVGQGKGVASTKYNKRYGQERPFAWQKEYGIFSFAHKQLADYVAYVEKQKAHHAKAQVIFALERMS